MLMLQVVIDNIINFLRNEQLWKVEHICFEMMHSLLSCRASPEILLHNMLDDIEEMMAIDFIDEIRHFVQVLHSIISDERFAVIQYSGGIRVLSLYQAFTSSVSEMSGFSQQFSSLLSKYYEIIWHCTFESQQLATKTSEVYSTWWHRAMKLRLFLLHGS